MKIKFCGLKTVEDYICAWELGVDYVGFVCYEKSPRYIAPTHIAEILDMAGSMKTDASKPKPKTVGLFVDWSKDRVLDAIHRVGFDIAQIYNDEMIEYLPIPYWKVIHIGTAEDIESLGIIKEEYDENKLAALVFDTKTDIKTDTNTELSDTKEILLGGSGKSFNWDYLDSMRLEMPYFVAGGINKSNVLDLVKKNPYGIDMSSGLETVRGIKDHRLMREIVALMRTNLV